MSVFRRRPAQVTIDELIDRYAEVLEHGPQAGPFATLHPISDLPAEKPLMMAALIAQAYKLGPSSLDTLKAAFIALANFQADTREPASKHSEVLAEMTILAMEFSARTKSLSERSDA